MNDGQDDGAAERIQKEQVFLFKPALRLFAHSRPFEKCRRYEQKKGRKEQQMKRVARLVEARRSDQQRDAKLDRHYTHLYRL